MMNLQVASNFSYLGRTKGNFDSGTYDVVFEQLAISISRLLPLDPAGSSGVAVS